MEAAKVVLGTAAEAMVTGGWGVATARAAWGWVGGAEEATAPATGAAG